MPPTTTPFRRADDNRFSELKGEVADIKETVGEIRDMLISEPEASPLGRALLSRSRENRQDIERNDGRLTSLETWRSEWRGSWRLILVVGTVLSIIGAFFGIAAYFGWHP